MTMGLCGMYNYQLQHSRKTCQIS